MDDNVEEHLQVNGEDWNRLTRLHEDNLFYDLKGFKPGTNRLRSIERTGPGSTPAPIHHKLRRLRQLPE